MPAKVEDSSFAHSMKSYATDDDLVVIDLDTFPGAAADDGKVEVNYSALHTNMDYGYDGDSCGSYDGDDLGDSCGSYDGDGLWDSCGSYDGGDWGYSYDSYGDD